MIKSMMVEGTEGRGEATSEGGTGFGQTRGRDEETNDEMNDEEDKRNCIQLITNDIEKQINI